MKIRTDFVSNSSSSSFIVDDKMNLSTLNVTKEDLISAMCLLMGIEESDKDKYFEVLDCEDEKDMGIIDSKYKTILDGFYSNCVFVKRDSNGEVIQLMDFPNDDNISDFESFCDTLCKIYDIGYISYRTHNDEVKIHRYNGEDNADTSMDEVISGMVKKAYNALGISSNYEVIYNGLGRFLIHVYDGCFNMMDDMCIDGDTNESTSYKSKLGIKKYETNDSSLLRFNEILLVALYQLKGKDTSDIAFVMLNDLVGGCLHEG